MADEETVSTAILVKMMAALDADLIDATLRINYARQILGGAPMPARGDPRVVVVAWLAALDWPALHAQTLSGGFAGGPQDQTWKDCLLTLAREDPRLVIDHN